MKESESNPQRFRGYIRPYAWALVLSLLLAVVVGILEAISPFLIGLVFDMVLEQSAAPTLDIPFFDDVTLDVPAEYGVWILVALVVSTILKAGSTA